MTICPLCRLDNQSNEKIIVCRCGLIYRDDYLADRSSIYNKDYSVWGEDNESTRQSKISHFSYLLDNIEQKGKLLDIGTGRGYLLEAAKAKGFDVYGVEISDLKQYERIFKGTLEEAKYPSNFFDVITMTDIIEHISDPFSFFKEVRRILKPGGTILITTPNTDSITRKIMGKGWFQYKDEHIIYFNKNSMKYCLDKFGFNIIKSVNNKKKLQLRYYYDYFEKYPSLIGKIFRLGFKILPSPLKKKSFINPITGEMLVMAKKCDTKQIVLVNPPLSNEERYGIKFKAGGQTPPNGLAIIAAVVRKNWTTAIIDGAAEGLNYDNIVDRIISYDASYVGLTASTVSIFNAMEIAKRIKEKNKDIKVILGGAHITAAPEETLEKFKGLIDYGVIREGERTFPELLTALDNKKSTKKIPGLIYYDKNKIIRTLPRDYILNLDEVPVPAWDLLPNLAEHYCPPVHTLKKFPAAMIVTSRGCPGMCLAGDTIVHTTEGDIPIKDLVRRKDIGVYTYSRKTKEVFITKSNGCFKMGEKELVRVNFDDGTHIDCTPDHKFLTFLNGNQSVDTREIIKEAKDLKFHESVRAIKFYKHKGYVDVNWGRHKHKTQHQMIMEYLIGRKIKHPETIHHLNGNRNDNRIKNLQLCKDWTKHWDYHRQEASERMKKDNPAFHMTAEWRRKITKAVTGKKRTLQQRINYRNSKLGNKNPRFMNHKYKRIRKSRIPGLKIGPQINHKVISVEKIGKQMTYDLSVPETHWFFANNVLVHNCAFCDNSVFGRRYRWHSPRYIINMIKILKEKYGIKEVQFKDDNLVVNKVMLKELCEIMINEKLNISWNCSGRVDMVNPEILKLMKEAGCWQIWYGLESGSDKVLKELKKNITVEQIRYAIKITKEAGISSGGFFMIGNPSETEEDIKMTLNLLLELPLDEFHISHLTPFPGSELYRTADQYGIFDRDWKKMNGWQILFIPNGLTKEQLVHYSNLAFRKFYFRPRIIWNYAMKIRSFKLLKIYFEAFLGFLNFTGQKKR